MLGIKSRARQHTELLDPALSVLLLTGKLQCWNHVLVFGYCKCCCDFSQTWILVGVDVCCHWLYNVSNSYVILDFVGTSCTALHSHLKYLVIPLLYSFVSTWCSFHFINPMVVFICFFLWPVRLNTLLVWGLEYLLTNIYKCKYKYIYTHIYTYMYIYIYIHVHMHAQINIYLYIYTCIYVWRLFNSFAHLKYLYFYVNVWMHVPLHSPVWGSHRRTLYVLLCLSLTLEYAILARLVGQHPAHF